MATKPCSKCNRVPRAKMATLFPARFAEGNKRISYRVQMCLPCGAGLKPVMIMAMADSDSEYIEWPETCPSCGTKLAQTVDPLYVTVFWPGTEMRQLVLPLCDNCSPLAWQTLTSGGELTDQNGQVAPNGRAISEVPW